jgi:MmyB-like transcription regulator ligand binding domain
VQRILDAMIGAPAYARNGRGDILATNRLGHALYSEMFASPRMANLVVAARIERSRPSAAWKCQPMTKG